MQSVITLKLLDQKGKILKQIQSEDPIYLTFRLHESIRITHCNGCEQDPTNGNIFKISDIIHEVTEKHYITINAIII